MLIEHDADEVAIPKLIEFLKVATIYYLIILFIQQIY